MPRLTALAQRLALSALIGCISIITCPSARAEDHSGSGSALIRISYDVSGQPVCTVARAATGDSTPVGTVIPCPPAVKALTPTPPPASGGSTSGGSATGGTTGSTTTGGGTTTGSGDSGNSGNSSGASPATPATPSPIAITRLLDSTVTLAGVVHGNSLSSLLRFANYSTTTGTATVVVVDPATGSTLATWTSAQVASRAGLQINVGDLIAAASLEPGAGIPAVVELHVTSSFAGEVQHLIALAGSGLVTDASACGNNVIANRERLGFVPADNAATTSSVRIVNPGTAGASATLVLRDAASGTSLGQWTSPSIPAAGAVTVALATLVGAAGTTASGYFVDMASLPMPLRLELVAADAVTGAVFDQTLGCTLPATNP